MSGGQGMQTRDEELFNWTNHFRVVLVHSRYSSRQSSGENAAVDRQAAALRRARFAVHVAEQQTDQRERSPLYPLTAAATVATGVGPSPLEAIRRFEPDVVHVHNLFPNYGRSWLRKVDRPIVATLHNFRPLCPAATFYRDGHVCTDCLDRRSARPSVEHGCYRGSRLQTVPLALSTRFDDDPLLRRADRLIVLTETMRQLYERAGVPSQKLTVLPNFLADPGKPGQGGGPWLFVGRLSPEKGILELVRDWPTNRPLLVVGDGPLRDEVAATAPDSVQLLGDRPAAEVRKLMDAATGLVFPSRWFEGSPMVYVEALASGTPVLAWSPSSVADLVVTEGTGLRVENRLDAVLAHAARLFPEMRSACRAVFEERYSEAGHVAALSGIYQQVAA